MIFSVPGIPVAKGRPRFARVGRGVRTFTPEATTRYEDRVRNAAHMHGVQLIEGAVRVVIEAVWPTRGQPRKRDPRPAEPKVTKPDSDNVAKAILDSLNGIAWHDDSQVVELTVRKRHAAQGEAACATVQIEPYTPAG